MDKKTRLKKLEDLFLNDEVKAKFSTREGCLEWSSKVAPLLRFNALMYEDFTSNASFLKSDISLVLRRPAVDNMINIVRMAIEELKVDIEGDQDKRDIYVNEERLKTLRTIRKNTFDLTRLIRMLEELNECSQADCHMATIMLVRAVLDHVPPIFEYGTFKEVANNYRGQGSFKISMEHLENSSRKIADQHLHGPIRNKEVLPNNTQVNFRNDLDVLLAEIVRIL
jgi:hypothetical protein